MTLEQQLAATEAKRSAVCEQFNELKREALALHEQCRNLRDQIAEREIARSVAPNWPLLLVEDNATVTHKALNNALAGFGMQSNGYHPDTMQRCVEICLYSKDHPEGAQRLAETFDGLQKLLPYVEPIDDFKYFSVLERTLSEFGVYTLHIGDKTCELRKTTYGSERIIFSSNSLLETLEYIQVHHPYDAE